eukprot:GEMP01041834.1.p1 GENE.GEMP01041834.1~~GEMP01041834.1.p1  ORF type:complete len:408 (+),score=66.71 GEMP01041834.1:86-1309(+)
MSSTPVCCFECFEKLKGCFHPASIKNKPDIHARYFKRFIAEKRPVRVIITGVGNDVGYALLPLIANGDVFGQEQPVIIHGIDVSVEHVQDNLKGIRMELEDGYFPLLRGIMFTTDHEAAFSNVDYAILMSVDSSGVDAVRSQMLLDAGQVLKNNVDNFKFFGQQIEKYASRKCKVMIIGPNANTHCIICSYMAPSLPFQNFTACARLEQNRAQSEIARYCDAFPSDVRNMIIWGTLDTRTLFADAVTVCTVRGQRTSALLADDSWLKNNLQRLLRMRHKRVLGSQHAQALALTHARAISQHMHDWVLGTREGGIISMGVITKDSRLSSASNGNAPPGIDAAAESTLVNRFYGVAEGLCFVLPVQCKNGEWEVVQGLAIDEFTQQEISKAEESLKAERKHASLQLQAR